MTNTYKRWEVLQRVGLGYTDINRKNREDALSSRIAFFLAMFFIGATFFMFFLYSYGNRPKEMPELQADISEGGDILQPEKPQETVESVPAM